MSRTEHDAWSQDRREIDRGLIFGLSRGAAIFIAFLLVSAVVGIGIWFFQVTTSDIKGQGDAQREINSSDNRLFAQGNYNDRYQEILAADRRIDVAQAALAANPKDATLQANLTGAEQYCITIVGQYNADARKIKLQKFRDADLPAVIDNNDDATDCKASAATHIKETPAS